MAAREGLSVERIARKLDAEGIPTARGPGWSDRCAGRWKWNTVKMMLSNPVYCGDLAWNRRTLARFHRIGAGGAEVRPDAALRRVSMNPEGVWIVTRNTHPALVDSAEWELAQRAMRSRQRRR